MNIVILMTGSVVVVASVLLASACTRRRNVWRTQEEQVARLGAAGQLSLGLAHDMNNLLTVIQGCGEQIKSATDSDEIRDGAVLILTACESGVRLTRKIFSCCNAPKAESEMVDVGAHIIDLEPLLRGLMGPESQLRLDTCTDAAFVRVCRADLDQILVNLVTNSRDAGASRVNVRTRRITYDARSASDTAAWVVLEIVDNGPGFCSEALVRATQSFFTKNKCGGRGIGLATVQQIVKDLGGELAIDNTDGGGAIVRIRLPESLLEASPKK